MNIFDNIRENKCIILFISIFLNVLLMISLFISIYLYFNKKCICEKEIVKNEIVEKECDNVLEEDNSFFVEIKGAINEPGVYEVNSNNIINDVVTMAGGFTNNAYTDNINLSKKVEKELVIYIYEEKDFKKETPKKVDNVCICPSYDITVCIEEKKSEILPDDNNVVDNNKVDNNTDIKDNDKIENDIVDTNKKININVATKTELMKLSGIGESKAEKIIEYREKNGGFKNIDEIKKVNGIGEAIYEKIKDSITV